MYEYSDYGMHIIYTHTMYIHITLVKILSPTAVAVAQLVAAT